MSEKLERSAPGKLILCGEHSVVYGRPAIAIPVSGMRVHVRIAPAPAGAGLSFESKSMRLRLALRATDRSDPLGRAARLVLEYLGAQEPDAHMTITSDLPVAGGMGSGAAVAAATLRALGAYLGTELTNETVSAMTYEVERIHHGTPSGIDNTVIAWEMPVYFVKGQAAERFTIGTPLDILIASSGIASSTREAVAEVRRRWELSTEYYEMVFDCIGAMAKAARAAVEQGALHALGTLLNENHELLVKIGVSVPALDAMVHAARESGALGAKLTGSGQGGNMIALVAPEDRDRVQEALWKAGARQVWATCVGA